MDSHVDFLQTWPQPTKPETLSIFSDESIKSGSFLPQKILSAITPHLELESKWDFNISNEFGETIFESSS